MNVRALLLTGVFCSAIAAPAYATPPTPAPAPHPIAHDAAHTATPQAPAGQATPSSEHPGGLHLGVTVPILRVPGLPSRFQLPGAGGKLRLETQVGLRGSESKVRYTGGAEGAGSREVAVSAGHPSKGTFTTGASLTTVAKAESGATPETTSRSVSVESTRNKLLTRAGVGFESDHQGGSHPRDTSVGLSTEKPRSGDDASRVTRATVERAEPKTDGSTERRAAELRLQDGHVSAEMKQAQQRPDGTSTVNIGRVREGGVEGVHQKLDASGHLSKERSATLERGPDGDFKTTVRTGNAERTRSIEIGNEGADRPHFMKRLKDLVIGTKRTDPAQP